MIGNLRHFLVPPYYLAALICFLALVPVGMAQTNAPASATTPLPPEAQAAVDKGVLAARQQDYLLAIRYFQDARKLAPQSPELFFDFGLAESKIPGRELRAMAWFGAYLAANPNATNAAAVKDLINVLDVKSQSNNSRLIETVQDAVSPTMQYKDNDLYTVAELWAEAGDITAALKIVDLFQSADGKTYVQEAIARGQTKAGDIVGAQKTADSIQDSYYKIRAQLGIAKRQVSAKDSAGAQKTLASALKAADLIPNVGNKSAVQCDIAEAQADADDMAGAQMTFASALRNANLMQDNGLIKLMHVYHIAVTQAVVYDIAGAQKTAELLQDTSDQAWKSGAQKAIADRQMLLKAGVGHIPKSTPNTVAQTPVQPAVPVVTVSDWLKKLDDEEFIEDSIDDDCALNTRLFLDLAAYLKSLPLSDNPQKVFETLRNTAQKTVVAQNIIDGMLRQQAGK